MDRRLDRAAPAAAECATPERVTRIIEIEGADTVRNGPVRVDLVTPVRSLKRCNGNSVRHCLVVRDDCDSNVAGRSHVGITGRKPQDVSSGSAKGRAAGRRTSIE